MNIYYAIQSLLLASEACQVPLQYEGMHELGQAVTCYLACCYRE